MTTEVSNSGLSKLNQHLNVQAFLSGALLMGALFLCGLYIQNQIILSSDNFTPLFVSIFTGLAFGHHLGKATQNNRDSLTSAYLGALLVLSSIVLYYLRIQPISGVLLIMTAAIFLSHTSGLISNNQSIERLIDFLSGDISPFALSGLGIIRYLIPYLVLISNPSETIQRILRPEVLVLLFMLIISIYEYLKLRKQTKRIAEHANYMYDLGRETSVTGSQQDEPSTSNN